MREFGIAASHKLTWSPGPNPSESGTNRPSDMGSIPKVFTSKQGQYVLLCYSYGFFMGFRYIAFLVLDWHPALLEGKPASSSAGLPSHIAA